MTAAERFKALYATAVERVCILEEQLENARSLIALLEEKAAEAEAATAKRPAKRKRRTK